MITRHTTRCALIVLAMAAAPIAARAQSYPKTLIATTEATSAAGTSTATLTIRIEQLMEDLYFKRVSNALRQDGYQKFFPALRALPSIGYVQLGDKKTDLKYAREREAKPRLVLGTDRPIFFIGGGAPDAKPRTGYEMAVIELDIDAQGNGTGIITPAARVKHVPDGVVVEGYAEKPLQLTVQPAK